MNSKDAQILVQVGAKVAGDIVAADPNLNYNNFAQVLDHVVDIIDAKIDSIPTESSVYVQQPVAPAPVPTQQAVQNVTAQLGGAVVPAPDARDDVWWDYYLANPGEFWDNRDRGDTSITGGNSPDFRARDLLDKTGRPKGLFLVSRRFGRTAPDKVFQALGIAKPNLDQQSAPVPAATTPAPAAAPF